MQKISPCLWFNNQAEEAVKFYTSIFKNSKMGGIDRYDEAGSKEAGMPVGSVLFIDFEIEGQQFGALNGGPIFQLSPAISFTINCDSREEIDRLWGELSAGGQVLMEIDKYPWSERYGWLNDKFGVSWQLNLGEATDKITPYFTFVGDQFGKAEEAINYYASIFQNANVGKIYRYEKGGQEKEGAVMHAEFKLEGMPFYASESSLDHKWGFTPAVSLIVNCKDQEEVDRLWGKLSAVKEAEQCGWLCDKFGVSWQIVPDILFKYLRDPDPAKAKRVMEAMLEMHKLDIAALRRAYEQG